MTRFAGGCGLLRDILRLGRELLALSGIGPLLGRGALVLLVRQLLASRLRQVSLAGVLALLPRLRAPFLFLPLPEMVVLRLPALVAAAALLVFLHGHLRLAGRPLAGVAAFFAAGDLVLDRFPKLRIGLLRCRCHGSGLVAMINVPGQQGAPLTGSDRQTPNVGVDTDVRTGA